MAFFFLPAASYLLAFVLAGQAEIGTGPPRGSLIAVGGGKVGPVIMDRFVSLAGGADAHFVMISTAGDDREIDMDLLKKRNPELFALAHLTVLHTRDRHEADSDEFVAPLREASGVWISGGRQWRLVDSYLNTRTLRELRVLLDRGGVIAGTSAGATIQASYLVRGAREGNEIMMAKGYEEGFGFLRNVAIDQHWIARHRENDLVEVVTAHPELLGIGIDEATAIVVRGDRFEVIGASKVGIFDGKDHDGKRYFLLSPGDQFDFKLRTTR